MKTKLLKSILFASLLTVAVGFGNAQEYIDAENCKDHPFLDRLEKYYIADCKENYNEYEFIMGSEKSETWEGNLTEILYSYAGSFGPHLPSKLQIVKNYENAILKLGGKKIYSRTTDDGDWTGATFYFQKDDKEYWVGIYNMINNPVDEYSLVVLTKEVIK